MFKYVDLVVRFSTHRCVQREKKGGPASHPPGISYEKHCFVFAVVTNECVTIKSTVIKLPLGVVLPCRVGKQVCWKVWPRPGESVILKGLKSWPV